MLFDLFFPWESLGEVGWDETARGWSGGWWYVYSSGVWMCLDVGIDVHAQPQSLSHSSLKRHLVSFGFAVAWRGDRCCEWSEAAARKC